MISIVKIFKSNQIFVFPEEKKIVCAICYGVNILIGQYAILLTFESREEVGIHIIRLLKFFLKLSDFIPHKSHYVIIHSSDIKSDPP